MTKRFRGFLMENWSALIVAHSICSIPQGLVLARDLRVRRASATMEMSPIRQLEAEPT